MPSSPKDEAAHTAARFCLRVDANDILLEGVDPSPSRPHLPETRPPFPRHLTQFSVHSSTSQDSVFSGPQSSTTSTQTEESVDTSGKGLQDHPTASSTPKNRIMLGETVVSSPLSSPPPILFDPYENHTQLTQESSQSNSECSDSSDTEDTQRSLDFLSSQTSNPSLRNMKGRDLFDSNIWADPLKTSVFYRFATSLRQKVREVQPTATHHFIAQLRDVGKLARVYTQNIDEIEKKIGLSTDLRNGAGNKRRKSAKQQILTGSDSDMKENMAQPKVEEDSSTNGKVDTNQPGSQAPEDAERAKSRPSLTPDKGVECVFLHGSLHSLRCFVCGKLCDWDADNRESRTLSGEQPECPHCAGATAARQEKGKRALGVGKLRPDIVLYGEEHPESDLISPIVQYDLSAGPDLLLVLGTSLRVHGLKVMVKEFAKAVHQKGGKVVFINFTKPSESVWGDIIDYWIEWDCDAWVTDLKDRKPHLWLSPEEIQEQEKQKRETLAERRRENLLKRESTGDRKRDSLLGEKRRQTIETSKPRAPPKNPSAMRNDYGCGAYVVHDIFQSLAKIGDRPFDNLGYIPRQTIQPEPPPPSCRASSPSLASPAIASPAIVSPARVPPALTAKETKPAKAPAVKAKRPRPRKSAPAILNSRASSKPKSKSDGRPAVKARYRFTGISKTPIPPPVIPRLLPPPPSSSSRLPRPAPAAKPAPAPAPAPTTAPTPAKAPTKTLAKAPAPTPASSALPLPRPSPPPPSPPEEEQRSTTPSQDPSISIGAAVKTHPRRRKRKEIFEGPIVRPAPKQRRAAPQSTPIPPPMRFSSSAHTPQAEHNSYLPPQEAIILAPIRPGPEVSTPAIKCLEPNPNVSPPSPLAYTAPVRSRPYLFPYPSHPMLHSDPLGRLPYGADIRRDLCGPKIGERQPATKDATPSPSDQLHREHWEAAASLMSLGGVLP